MPSPARRQRRLALVARDDRVREAQMAKLGRFSGSCMVLW
jgi:hypothetical protein